MASEAQKRANKKWREANPQRWREIVRAAQRRHYYKKKAEGLKREWVKREEILATRPECDGCEHGVARMSREWEGHCSYPVKVIICKLSECVLDASE
jgi:hypothetical protein